MKTGKMYISRSDKLTVECPTCNNLLTDTKDSCCCAGYSRGSLKCDKKGWCSQCKEWFLIPDLSHIYRINDPKVVDAGLFQEMLDALKLYVSEQLTTSLLRDTGAVDEAIETVIAKAEKA